MPLFRFFCPACGREVDLFLSLGELSRGIAACPVCRGRNLEGPLADDPGRPDGRAGSPPPKSCLRP